MRRKGAKPKPDEKQCTAPNHLSGLRCGNWRAPGFKVCWKHGAGPQGSHQRRAVEVRTAREPVRYTFFKSRTLQAAYERCQGDPDRLDLKDELALLRTCLSAVLAVVKDADELRSRHASAVIVLVKEIGDIAKIISRIEADMKAVINPEQLQTIVDQLFTVIARHVPDKVVLAQIQEDLDYIAMPSAGK